LLKKITDKKTEPSAMRPRSPTRKGKRAVTVYLDETSWRELKQLGLDKDRTIQSLVEKAIKLLLRHRPDRST